jgi:hypothetical protein
MVSVTHLDGADVVVLDSHGRRVPAVDEVRVELDRAVVALQSETWSQSFRELAAEIIAIHSARDGRLHWRGPVRLVCV